MFWLWSTARQTGNKAVYMGWLKNLPIRFVWGLIEESPSMDIRTYRWKQEVPPSFMVRQDYSV